MWGMSRGEAVASALAAARDQPDESVPPVDASESAIRRFLAEHAALRVAASGGAEVGGRREQESLEILSEATQEEERDLITQARAWRRTVFDAGYGWLDGPRELGGAGLGREATSRYRRLERDYDVPDQSPFIVGLSIVAPAILAHGTPAQKATYLPGLYSGDLFACQLFSEPGHGSDLAGIETYAVQDGQQWVVRGQKVWTSYAQYSNVGLLLARTDRDAPRHRNLTMFLIDMDQPGVEVRPLPQMTGGAHFNEVFLSDAVVSDHRRLGEVGSGWRVAVTTLLSEREAVGSGDESPAMALADRLIDLYHRAQPTPSAVRQQQRHAVAEAAVLAWVLDLTSERLSSSAGGHPGPEMSVTKLLRNRFLDVLVNTGCAIAGPSAAADSGLWGTYVWGRARLATPGLRLAGGTDEIQRNILGERVLGLPRDPEPPDIRQSRRSHHP
jgi:acyl-CoA dehydrogenase